MCRSISQQSKERAGGVRKGGGRREIGKEKGVRRRRKNGEESGREWEVGRGVEVEGGEGGEKGGRKEGKEGGKEMKKNERMSTKTYDQQMWNDMEIPHVKVFQVLGVRLISMQVMAK